MIAGTKGQTHCPEAYLSAVGLTDAMLALDSAASTTAWLHPRLHGAPCEVLQLMVDVKVPDAAVEAGQVEGLRPEARCGWHHLLRHSCEGTHL